MIEVGSEQRSLFRRRPSGVSVGELVSIEEGDAAASLGHVHRRYVAL